MQEKLKFSKSQGASTPAEIQCMQNIPYASAVGSIMCAVRCTRPDVAFAQNITSRFQQNPGDQEMKRSAFSCYNRRCRDLGLPSLALKIHRTALNMGILLCKANMDYHGKKGALKRATKFRTCALAGTIDMVEALLNLDVTPYTDKIIAEYIWPEQMWPTNQGYACF
ncbi:hypothetical protein Tco_1476185 [Tanacetum coccineum]